MRQLSVFVALAALLFLHVSPALAFPAAPKWPEPPQFGYDEAAAWAVEFDAAYDALPDDIKVGIKTRAELDDWAKEMLPFYDYEGIDPTGMIVFPSSLHFEAYSDGLHHNHVLGQTNCFSGEVTLNDRFANPVSSWYGRIDDIATLAHEFAHLQGICTPDRLDEETSAQLVALEILAAMTDKGNERAFAALVNELSDMALTAAQAAATAENRQDDFQALLLKVEPSPWDQARFQKSIRYWASDPDTLQRILTSYNFVPMQELYRALKTDDAIQGVQLPRNVMRCYVDVASEYSSQSKEPCVKDPLVVDDLAYVIGHLDELVASA
jgi:hypothetical protein